MPKRTDIHTILILGSGPIIIGQACEFDYSGTQACKALRRLGYRIVLVNSNPATIMTDPEIADVTYVEPMNAKRLAEIIAKELPDALLPNLGGQSAMNLSVELFKSGVLERHGVRLVGVTAEAIERGEDPLAFEAMMNRLGVEMPRSRPAWSVAEAEAIAAELDFPVVVRPAFATGSTVGGIVQSLDELRAVAARGLEDSFVGQILVEESLAGWEEFELEMMRDADGRVLTVCCIENVDPMGVHTGDSVCVSPMQTVPASLRGRLETQARAIVEALGVVGSTNVQFAHDPASGRIAIIEFTLRASRSSALASKATGFPVASISTMLATGVTLDELPYASGTMRSNPSLETGGTLAGYRQPEEWVAVKFPRWAFEKLPGAVDRLGMQMHAVGEAMGIGKTFKEAAQKAVRSLEIGRFGFGFAKDFHDRPLPELLELLAQASSERFFILYEALRKGASVEELHRKTAIGSWFLVQLKELVELEEEILKHRGGALPDALLAQAKKDGFADAYLAALLDLPEAELRARRKAAGLVPGWESIPVCGFEPACFHYSTYSATGGAAASDRRKVMVLGGGPNRIGQGVEFDYCCVHAAFALRDLGFETVMVNCSPDTVSTDYDVSDRLYFEPLTIEDVLAVCEKEKPLGVIVQFGGQTPLNLAASLEQAGVRILGTSPETIDLAENRDRFRNLMEKLGIPVPDSGTAASEAEALAAARRIGYPLMLRPSYVLGGRGMQIVNDDESLRRCMTAMEGVSPERPMLVERFLLQATEAEADAVCDGSDAFVPTVMEHIELAGIHSGDSACVIPPVAIPESHRNTIIAHTRRIAQALGVVGLLNVQFAIADGRVYVLEANPRASRTVPLVSKVCNLRLARIATEIAMASETGAPSPLPTMRTEELHFFGVKEAVFPFNMYPEVDPVLGPEMRSTGEVLGLSKNFGVAWCKAQEATMCPLPYSGTVFMSLAEADLAHAVEVAKAFLAAGFTIKATEETARHLMDRNIAVVTVKKPTEGRPNVLDGIRNGGIQLVVNTPAAGGGLDDDSYIRKAAIRRRIPYITTLAAALASANGIRAVALAGGAEVMPLSLQEYHNAIR